MDMEKLRQDFPAIQQEVKGKKPIYFDSACMALKPRQVIDAVVEYYEKYPGCGARGVHLFGQKVTEKHDECRKVTAKHFGVKEKEIVFSKNATESLNLVYNSLDFNKGDIIITTDKEHNSNLVPAQIIAERKGLVHKTVKGKEDNTFDIEAFKNIVSKDVKLVSVVHTSNLDGVTNPVREIIKIAHDAGALVMLDGAQSAPHKSINLKKIDADFFACSGHKMMGPTGMGILFGKEKLLDKLAPFIAGGETVEATTMSTHKFLKPPEKFEAGLQHYAGFGGLTEAIKYLDSVGMDNIEKHDIMLNKYATEKLFEIPGFSLIGPKDPSLRSGIISFNIGKMNSHDVALILDENAKIMVRSGQHCVHSWFNAHGIEGSCRASLYLYNTKEEIDIFVDILKKVQKLG
ncbi:MAG: aminotransferase class V-fold PLP-dependent enzyme [Nanoarchaeota archaeon]